MSAPPPERRRQGPCRPVAALALMALALAGCAHAPGHDENAAAPSGHALGKTLDADTANTAAAAPALAVKPPLRALNGRIEGLTGQGLVLTDALGNVVRPVAGARQFTFRGGQPYIQPDDPVHLIIVKQPAGQACAVATEAGQPRPLIRCAPTRAKTAKKPPPAMRDCFQVFTQQGAVFTLGRKVKNQWEPYAQVTMDSLGAQRLHHRTFLLPEGRQAAAFESITLLQAQPLPQAMVELMLSSEGEGSQGERTRSVGKWGAMPLDLRVGEERRYTVIVQSAGADGVSRTESLKKTVRLARIGPLKTRAGSFALTCHLVERATIHGRQHIWQTWYAPGYGPVRLTGRAPGILNESFEALEIHQSPK
ncbi:MAG: hypothetical protein LBP52_02420 [Burkholderiaceae bacterium]|jgi:hypothetical protein|nr:hypothetical protein [Burkholderiaceae bacterium]